MFQNLLDQISKCTICASDLPYGPRPVVQASPKSKIAIIGQAPGRRVHESGVPWDDPSGNRLREWLNVDNATFYDPDYYALIPMGFCYPGSGKSGDLPPRPECAPEWHNKLLDRMPDLKLTLLLGQYAQRYYLKDRMGKNLTETVKKYREYLPEFIPLPHPSPRNIRWFKNNPWFEEEVLPLLRIFSKSAKNVES